MWVNCCVSIGSSDSPMVEDFIRKHFPTGTPNFVAGLPTTSFDDADLIEAWGCPGLATPIPGHQLARSEWEAGLKCYFSYFRVLYGPPIPWFLSVFQRELKGPQSLLSYASRASSAHGFISVKGTRVHRSEDEGDSLRTESFYLQHFKYPIPT